ncbi:hypothetical protein ZWY2020_039976 [Hordeum vulgare]|nr:hypothetical protein ZWY2020_039976 [Hordeum vulgare]
MDELLARSGAEDNPEWQVPTYCFTKDDNRTTKNTYVSEPGGHADESFIPKIRMRFRGHDGVNLIDSPHLGRR